MQAATIQTGPVDITPLPPSPTPVLVTVAAGDTLLGIALRYNITLETLLAANPGVDPQFLSVGTVLTIPGADGSVVADPVSQATPVPLELTQPKCWGQASGGEWCVISVHNANAYGVENILIQMDRVGSDGVIRISTEAAPLLDQIPADSALPVMVYFADAQPGEFTIASLVSAFSVAADSSRYLKTSFTEAVQVDIAPEGKQASVNGNIKLEGGQPDALRLWVLVVAYNADGGVVGVRRWENQAGLQSGANFNVSTEVYSLGPQITSVSVFVEARP
jgi:LysM repeat protein